MYNAYDIVYFLLSHYVNVLLFLNLFKGHFVSQIFCSHFGNLILGLTKTITRFHVVPGKPGNK